MKRGHTGTGLGGRVEQSPAAKKRRAKQRKREEARWARKSGSLVIRYECPICGDGHPRAECPRTAEQLDAALDAAVERDGE